MFGASPLDASPLDAYERVLSRAQDLRDAFRAGAIPLNRDVRTAPQIVPSSDPLSVVPPPGAWLVTRGADGVRAYERDGALTLDDGVLRTRNGAEVLGYPGGQSRNAVPVPLRVPEIDGALGRARDARVEDDGTVAYVRAAIDPRTGARGEERIVLGRVAVARFPAGTQPARLDGTRVAAPPGVVPHLGTPADGTFAPLETASRDAGAIDIAAGVARLDEAYRAFEALGAAVKSRASVQKTAVDLVK
jgi:flagellar basal body rod protein FlgG